MSLVTLAAILEFMALICAMYALAIAVRILLEWMKKNHGRDGQP